MLRSGQWCKFEIDEKAQIILPIMHGKEGPTPVVVDDAALQFALSRVHFAADGRAVGIYVKPGIDPVTDKPTPEHIVAVAKNTGTNVRIPSESEMVLMAFAPRSLSHLEPITSREDIPIGRLASMDPNWQPVA